ncbi:hypothetical protein C2E23DRAFT_696267, partial [Lenzites betulinus]
LRASSLVGLEIPGLQERIISTMFADDTTVFLSARDKYSHMNNLLNKWCAGARAKFNEPKTVIIPIGPVGGRNRVRMDRTLTPGGEPLPNDVKILDEGEGTRILGAWLGPAYDDSEPWTKIVATINKNLERWGSRKPTLRGRQVIINLEIGSRTQYLTRVQGMPKNIEDALTKMTAAFLWNGQRPPIAGNTTERPTSEGGIRVLNIRARNEAIHLMWAKTYLDLSPSRPKWAFVADALIARAILASQRRIDPTARVNTFLQNWGVNTATPAGLSRDLAAMKKAAKKYGVKLDAPTPSSDLIGLLPVWYH